jgi:phosphoenolpyruvate carboxylase
LNFSNPCSEDRSDIEGRLKINMKLIRITIQKLERFRKEEIAGETNKITINVIKPKIIDLR